MGWFADVKNLSTDGMFLFLAFASFMCVAGTGIISPALPVIAEGVSVTESQIGLLITAFTLPAIFILPFSGYLADNLGRNRIMAAGSLLIGFAGLAAYATNDFRMLVVFRFIQGVGQAGVMPLTVAIIGDVYQGPKQTQAQGLRGTSNKMGSMLWPVLGGLLAGLSWNSIFLIYVLFIPLGIISYFKIPVSDSRGRNPVEYMQGMRSLIARPRISVYLFLGFVRMFVKFSVITYMPILLSSRYYLAPALIGSYMALRGLGGFVSSSSAGLFDTRFGKERPIFASFTVIGLSAVLVAMTGSMAVVVVMLLLYGFMDSLFSAVHKSLLNESVEDEHRVGLMTTNSLAQNIGATAAPLVIGAILFLNSEIWLYAVGLLSIAGSVLFAAVNRISDER